MGGSAAARKGRGEGAARRRRLGGGELLRRGLAARREGEHAFIVRAWSSEEPYLGENGGEAASPTSEMAAAGISTTSARVSASRDGG